MRDLGLTYINIWGNGELLVNRHNVSVLQDEKVVEIGCMTK